MIRRIYAPLVKISTAKYNRYNLQVNKTIVTNCYKRDVYREYFIPSKGEKLYIPMFSMPLYCLTIVKL